MSDAFEMVQQCGRGSDAPQCRRRGSRLTLLSRKRFSVGEFLRETTTDLLGQHSRLLKVRLKSMVPYAAPAPTVWPVLNRLATRNALQQRLPWLRLSNVLVSYERRRMERKLVWQRRWEWLARQKCRRRSSRLAAGLAVASSETTTNAASSGVDMVEQVNGQPSHHVMNADGTRRIRFRNPWESAQDDPGMIGFLRVLFDWNEQSRVTKERRTALCADATTPRFGLVETLADDVPGVVATWIGHASFILQFRSRVSNLPEQETASSMTVWTDPVFSTRASPFSFLGPHRLVPAWNLQMCPLPNVVCWSHNHYDHLDIPTVRALLRLAERASQPMHWLCPLGVGDLLRSECRRYERSSPTRHSVHELDWHEDVTIRSMRFVCTPAQHFSGRTLWDRDRTLWAGWVMIDGESGTRCYFAGDTGYRRVAREDRDYPFPNENVRREQANSGLRPACPAFADIGAKYGPFDLSMIPIGAYSPRWFMSRVHVDPVDSVAIHKDVRSRQSVAMHHSTFVLTDEGLDDPKERLALARSDAQLKEGDFVIMRHGETRCFMRSTQ